MAYTYLGLVNRLCRRLNEVELTADNFDAATGVYSDFKDAVNDAYLDICQEEDNEWPFNWVETTFTTTIGERNYLKATTAVNLDWDSFTTIRQSLDVDTLTHVGGLATLTVSDGHQLVTGDQIIIRGADQTGYNSMYYITVTSPTEATFTVDSSLTSPATGIIKVTLPYLSNKLDKIEYDQYRKEGKLEQDLERIDLDDFGIPCFVVRKPDNNFVITPTPDRIYTVRYEYFTMPVRLTSATEVPIIPPAFEDVLVDGATIHGYFFRDNIEQLDRVERRYTNGVNRMRRILIPQPEYARVVD